MWQGGIDPPNQNPADVPVRVTKFEQTVKLICRRTASPPSTRRSVVFARWRQCALRLTHGSSRPRSTRVCLQRHLDRFTRFCTCHTQTTPLSVAVGRICATALIHSRLKTFLFGKPFPLQPFIFFFTTDCMIP